jgi:hydroxypyruvate reductase
LSDVVGNPLAFIGSGPTVADTDASPMPPAAGILGQYDIATQLGRERWQRLAAALRKTQFSEAQPTHVVGNFVIGDVRQAAIAAQVRAMQLGFVSHLLTTHLEGEAREVGRVAAALARDLSPGHCLILGGETTVTIRGRGTGGRNQELALAAAVGLNGSRHTVVASFGTDGEDGPTTAAGAVVSGQTLMLGRRVGLEPQHFLDNNDSYHFFQRLDEVLGRGAMGLDSRGGEAALLAQTQGEGRAFAPHHIVTGSTGTNVNDLLFILNYEL